MAYIYKITNTINGKVYIGQTRKTLKERFESHLKDMNHKRYEHRPLYVAMKKYGVSNFNIEAIEKCEDHRSNEREQFWIRYYDSCNTGYNTALGGAGKLLFNHRDIYEMLLAGNSVNAVVQKFSCSADVVYAVAKKHDIDIVSSSAGIQNFLSRSKPVLCTSKSDNDDVIFMSTADAARYIKTKFNYSSALGGIRSHIADCCNGKRRSAYGYTFQYI